MDRLLRLARGIDGLNRTIGRGVSWLTALMVFVGAFNAVARYFDRAAGGGLSSSGSDSIAEEYFRDGLHFPLRLALLSATAPHPRSLRT